MKRYLLTGLLFAFGIICFPNITKAQYSPYVYNGNAYLNYALASRRARQMRKSHPARKKGVSFKGRNAYRKNRRVSMIKNFTEPNMFVTDLPRKTPVV